MLAQEILISKDEMNSVCTVMQQDKTWIWMETITQFESSKFSTLYLCALYLKHNLYFNCTISLLYSPLYSAPFFYILNDSSVSQTNHQCMPVFSNYYFSGSMQHYKKHNWCAKKQLFDFDISYLTACRKLNRNFKIKDNALLNENTANTGDFERKAIVCFKNK